MSDRLAELDSGGAVLVDPRGAHVPVQAAMHASSDCTCAPCPRRATPQAAAAVANQFSWSTNVIPLCTPEFIGFTRAAGSVQRMNSEWLGLSIDGLFLHRA